jgi:hypothetical protein
MEAPYKFEAIALDRSHHGFVNRIVRQVFRSLAESGTPKKCDKRP